MSRRRQLRRQGEIVRQQEEPLSDRFELEFELADDEGRYSFTRFNRHHILHTREQWDANQDTKRLRNSLGLIATIDIEAHQDLHKSTAPVPVLDIYSARRVANAYAPNPNPLQAIDNFSFAVQEAQRSPKTNTVERVLGDLVIHNVRAQIPWVRDGSVDATAPLPVDGTTARSWGALGLEYMPHVGRFKNVIP